MNEFLRRALMLPEQASTIARGIDYLHYFVIITTMAGAAGVAIASLYFIFRYREGAGRGNPRARAVSVQFEVGAFGALLALFVMWWVIGFRQYVKIMRPPPDAMTIYVVGKQWMWSFAYPEGGGSNGVLYVPAGRPIRLVLTSRDVIHSFYVPDFRLKMDAVPGRSTTLWFQADKPGHHQVFCAEMCGVGHSTMRAEVEVLSVADYERKLRNLGTVKVAAQEDYPEPTPGEARPRTYLTMASVGERIAGEAGCLRCHTTDGTPHIGPTWAGLYGAQVALADGTTVVADEAYLTSSMMDPMAQLHRGFPPVMPSYQGLLDAPQIGALVEYIRSLRDVTRDHGEVPLPAATTGVPIVTPLEGTR